MWIFCCGMPRSGSTVQYLLTKEIVENQGVAKIIGFVRKKEFADLYQESFAQYKYIIVKSHRYIPQALPLFESGQAKAVYTYRDMRDVVLSRIKKRSMDFGYDVALRIVRLNLNSYHQWQRVSPILVSRYEEMITDLKQEALRIASFLEIEISDDFAVGLAQKYSLAEQIKRIANIDAQGKNTRQTKIGAYYDQEMQLHSDHIRSGKSEQWKTEMSPMQIAFIEGRAYKWLLEHNYPISQSWLKRNISVFMNMLKVYKKSLKCMKRLIQKM